MNSSNATRQTSAGLNFSVVPYVQNIPKDGRSVLVTTYFDAERKVWQSYVIQDGKIQPFGFSKLVTGIYIAKEPANPDSDIPFDLSEIAFQYFGLPNLQKINSDVRHDISNALTSIQKYFVILNHTNSTKNLMDAKLMTPEIEYALTNHRSFYDLLNRAALAVFKHTKPVPRQIPESFREVAQKSADELELKYRLPLPMVCFYKEREPLFSILRNIRDHIVHHGASPDTVYHFEEGFGYGIDWGKISELRNYGLWPDQRLKPNNIGSLLELFAFLIEDMLAAAAALAQSLRRSFQVLPEAVAPGYHVYFCSELNFHIRRLSRYRTDPWMRPELGFRP